MYQVLYRKWRPKTFSDVYGQPQITTALKNELKSGRLAHAYLFTGSRGTGKTSCAKILAKAVNCLQPREGDPCNECDICRGIDEGTILDVVEIDAASNNGVDNIRDLREEVNFTPSVAKYRVYIIDEVHMLSAGAFNALLKTLEEPPAHVIFILATTEVHKLPATILSRCQRFDFNRIAPEDIAARIRYIAEHEEFTVTGDAALMLARLADGGMRDALSLLDQCVSRSKEVTAEVVADTTGMTGRDYLFKMSEAVRTGNGGAALNLIGQLYESSRDMERVCAELIEFYRNLMIIKSIPDPGGLIVAPPAEMEKIRSEAALYELPSILHCMDALQETLERLRSGASRRVEMEMAVLRLCSPELDMSKAALLRRIQALETAVKAGHIQAPSQTVTSQTVMPQTIPQHTMLAQDDEPAPPSEQPEAVNFDEMPPVPASENEAPAQGRSAAAPPAEGEVPFARWSDVLETLSAACMPLYGVLQNSTATLRGSYVLIQTDNDMFKSLVSHDGNKAILVDAIRGVTGCVYRIGIKKKAVSAGASAADDPLSAFIKNSRDLGIQIDVK